VFSYAWGYVYATTATAGGRDEGTSAAASAPPRAAPPALVARATGRSPSCRGRGWDGTRGGVVDRRGGGGCQRGVGGGRVTRGAREARSHRSGAYGCPARPFRATVPHLSRTRRPRPLSTADLVPAAGAPDRAGVFSTHFTLGTRDFLYLRTCSSTAAPHLSCRREHGLASSEAQLQNVHERRVRGVRYDLEPSALRPESLSGRQVVLGAGGLGQNVLEPPA